MRISDWSSDVCSSDLKELRVENLAMGPPGRPQLTLAGISFRLMAGEALGIVGASGSGKSPLVRALTGIWPPVQGRVRLDGAALDQYPPAIGRASGRERVCQYV